LALSDKQRWNERFVKFPMPSEASALLSEALLHVNAKRALDIACGTGRNTHFLIDRGIYVDAVDFSDYALEALRKDVKLNAIEADLDEYRIESQAYDVIVNVNFLARHLYSDIAQGLKKGGVLFFETFIIAHGEAYNQPSNPDFLLRKNELIEVFQDDLETIFYEERDDVNLRGEKVKIATYIGKKI
jgi:tellurite methyltransferase